MIDNITTDQVRRHLAQPPGRYSIDRLMALLSPAASELLEEMAQQARQLTIQRFGRTVQMYAPLYVSNVCVNSCLYCGFNCQTEFSRTRLTIDQAVKDGKVIASEGFRHILLVSGEDTKYVTNDYLAELAQRLREDFSSVSIEIYPLDEAGYKNCFDAGIDGVTLYQETYDRDTYERYHIAGPKADYDQRLDSYDRAARAGMRRLGLGVLLGLADWRQETLALAEHAAYLMKKYWRSQVSFSFPRLRPAPHVAEEYEHLVGERELVQMMIALRLCFADAGIVLSTRESAELRNNAVNLCVTRISAGSKTNPGGYSEEDDSTEQFVIADDRDPSEVAKMIKRAGREAVWKDWDTSFTA
ncbi:2-iminoacetate synthase [Anaerohalosphaera lusitana]|uniref:2-iminoacetate synthase n=2 Tax=Anaerohalosphaera lusitana TaxID=1936003 RepID=A0A1U9NI48_9BACT|nr:2-iminoacetate synthase [Anaerohalosphaera lusitana]